MNNSMFNEFNKTNLILWRFASLTLSLICAVMFLAGIYKGFIFASALMLLGFGFCLSSFVKSLNIQPIIKDSYDVAIEQQQLKKKWDNLKW